MNKAVFCIAQNTDQAESIVNDLIPAQPCVAVSFAAWLASLVSSLTPLTPVWYSYPGRDRP